MSNRVVLGALPGGGYGLRVSRPGYNVLDTGLQPKQIAFDSRWTKAGRVFMTGVKRTTFGGNNTVSFGRTFSTLPSVFSWLKNPNRPSQLDGYGISSITKSSVTFIAPQNTQFQPPYFDITYIIMWPIA